MRVLHVISSGGMYGAEAVILQLLAVAHTSPGDGGSLGVFHHRGSPIPELHRVADSAGTDSALIECRGQLDPSAVRSIQELAGRVRADIVHAHGYKADLYTFAAFRGNRRPALVSTCHTWYDNDIAVRLYGAADRWVLRHFDAVVAVSSEVRERLLRAGVDRERVRFIRNGLNVDPLGDAPSEGQTLQVGLVGRLAPEKGVDVYLRAAARIADTCPGTRFLVAGEGPERERLAMLIAELGLEGRALLLGALTEMNAFYRTLDLLVSASRQEGSPMALLEGMAGGLPVVATRVGEVPSLVDDEVTGLLVPPEEPEPLAEAMRRLLADASLRRRFGAAGKERVAQEFSAQRMAAEYRALYEHALKRSAARQGLPVRSAA